MIKEDEKDDVEEVIRDDISNAANEHQTLEYIINREF